MDLTHAAVDLYYLRLSRSSYEQLKDEMFKNEKAVLHMLYETKEELAEETEKLSILRNERTKAKNRVNYLIKKGASQEEKQAALEVYHGLQEEIMKSKKNELRIKGHYNTAKARYKALADDINEKETKAYIDSKIKVLNKAIGEIQNNVDVEQGRYEVVHTTGTYHITVNSVGLDGAKTHLSVTRVK